MPSASGPSPSEIAEATKHGVAWVRVRQPRGVTVSVSIGNGVYAFAPGDYVTVPRYAVRQLRLDGSIE